MIIPKKHKIWVTMLFNDSEYCITSPEYDRSIYSLYKLVEGSEYELLCTASNPLKLEQKVYESKV